MFILKLLGSVLGRFVEGTIMFPGVGHHSRGSIASCRLWCAPQNNTDSQVGIQLPPGLRA